MTPLETRMRGHLAEAYRRLYARGLTLNDDCILAAELARMLCECEDKVAAGFTREGHLRAGIAKTAAAMLEHKAL